MDMDMIPVHYRFRETGWMGCRRSWRKDLIDLWVSCENSVVFGDSSTEMRVPTRNYLC